MTKQFKYIAYVAAMLLLCCRGPQPVSTSPFQVANRIVFHQLLAENLSEDMALATQNDEILLYFSILEQDGKTWVERHQLSFEPFLFSKRGQQLALLDSLPLASFSPKSVAVFALIELDEENSAPKIRKLLRQSLSTGRFLQHVDIREMNTLLADDDFLGLQYYPLSSLERGKRLKIRFVGRHLFDPFAYVLTIRT
ncbi:MAG: hypothetical protein AAF985_07585 [Bacteroidota bacterium]